MEKENKQVFTASQLAGKEGQNQQMLKSIDNAKFDTMTGTESYPQKEFNNMMENNKLTENQIKIMSKMLNPLDNADKQSYEGISSVADPSGDTDME